MQVLWNIYKAGQPVRKYYTIKINIKKFIIQLMLFNLQKGDEKPLF